MIYLAKWFNENLVIMIQCSTNVLQHDNQKRYTQSDIRKELRLSTEPFLQPTNGRSLRLQHNVWKRFIYRKYIVTNVKLTNFCIFTFTA